MRINQLISLIWLQISNLNDYLVGNFITFERYYKMMGKLFNFKRKETQNIFLDL